MKSIVILTAWIGAAACHALANPVVTFTLTPPNGVVAGGAGTAVGWGYSIAVDSEYVTIQSILFGDLTPIGTFSTPGIPASVASVGSPINVPWVQGVSGLQYDISAAASLGASTQGIVTLVYDTYSDSALTNQVGFGDTVNAQFNSADVTAEVDVNAPAAPEPGYLPILLGFLVGMTAYAWRSVHIDRRR